DARLPASLCGLASANLGVSPLPTAFLAGAWSEPPLGMIFLGPGTLACYARPLQFVDCYERNQRIIDLSTKAGIFLFVSDAERRGTLWLRRRPSPRQSDATRLGAVRVGVGDSCPPQGRPGLLTRRRCRRRHHLERTRPGQFDSLARRRSPEPCRRATGALMSC